MRSDMLALGFETAQMTVAANLAGLSHEESLKQPQEAGNCVNWLAGHLLTSRDGLKQILGIGGHPSLNEVEAKAYKQGSSPLRERATAIQLDRLAQELQGASAAIVSKIRSMPEPQLDTLLDPKMFPVPVDQPVLANLLTLFLFHEAYHSGQIGLGRRLLGKSSGMKI
jgi:uncharacterized damage-inducible protein DinB